MKCTCGGPIVEADGELVCSSCGIVAGYETAPEVVAAPTSKMIDFDYGLTTVVGRRQTDHAGKRINMVETVRRMRRRDMWTQKYNRTMPAAMTQLSKLSDDLNMTDAASEFAAYIFRKAVASGFLRGRVVPYCTAAAALLACRRHGINRTFDDVVEVTKLEERKIYRTYRKLRDSLAPDLVVEAPDPTSFVARIGAEANVCEAARRRAQAILSSMDRTEVAGKDPMGLAASALYRACVDLGVNTRRRDIAAAARVAETTLSNRFHSLVV